MAHARVTFAAPLVLMFACGGAGSGPATATPAQPTASEPVATFQGTKWGTYHSKRFELSLGLPDGAAWKIDDHRSAWLRASHEPTRSSLALRSWAEDANVTK